MASQLPAGCFVIRGNFESLPTKVQDYVANQAEMCKPDNIYICDGSKEENESLINQLIEAGVLTKLHKYDNWYADFVLSYIVLSCVTSFLMFCFASVLLQSRIYSRLFVFPFTLSPSNLFQMFLGLLLKALDNDLPL